jgi:hypothetical protein
VGNYLSTDCKGLEFDLTAEHTVLQHLQHGEYNNYQELELVIESPVRSGYLPFLALTETLTGYNIFPILE